MQQRVTTFAKWMYIMKINSFHRWIFASHAASMRPAESTSFVEFWMAEELLGGHASSANPSFAAFSRWKGFSPGSPGAQTLPGSEPALISSTSKQAAGFMRRHDVAAIRSCRNKLGCTQHVLTTLNAQQRCVPRAPVEICLAAGWWQWRGLAACLRACVLFVLVACGFRTFSFGCVF